MLSQKFIKNIGTSLAVCIVLSASQVNFAADAVSSASTTEAKSSKVEATYQNTAVNQLGEFHAVKSGDVLWKIAKARGMSLESLIKLNPEIKNPNRIFIGQLIRISNTVSEQATPSTSTQTQTIIHVDSEIKNGVYRGTFIDGGYQQVGVEFTVINGKFEKIEYKLLKYKDEDYLKSEQAVIVGLTSQYNDLLKGIIGKNVKEGINLLYTPEKLSKDVTIGSDVITSASLRSTKVTSAIQDGLNRGPYRVLPTSVSYDDGVYRGTFVDGGYQQVGVEFKLVDNKISSISFKTLNYKEINYLKPEEGSKIALIAAQYEDLLNYLVGKDIRLHLNVLHNPGLIADDRGEAADAVSGATVRSAKVVSSIQDALNRGVYRYEGSSKPSNVIYSKKYENGVYRGSFLDANEQQVSIQFTLENNTMSSLSYRTLAYKKTNYLKDLESPKVSEFLSQYKQLISYMEGKNLNAVLDLYKPGDIVEDVMIGSDVISGATIRSAKVISAINDALNRGAYSMIK